MERQDRKVRFTTMGAEKTAMGCGWTNDQCFVEKTKPVLGICPQPALDGDFDDQ
jgi:hypothetical protein